jgi:transposase-like protein
MTRKLYRQRAAAFFRWAESRGLTLASIDASALAAYAEQIAAERSRHEASVYLTPVRGVLRHLAGSGLLASNPCPPGRPNGRGTAVMSEGDASHLPVSGSRRTEGDTATRQREEPGAGTLHTGLVPVGFPLLDLMAMLGHMDDPSLRRIFDEEPIALSLLEQVRWPDGPECPYCGVSAVDEPRAQVVCPACAKRYSVTTGTMFESSSVPVRLWFVVIHQAYLAESGLPDEELRQRFGLDLPAALALCRRIGEAVVQEGLPAGDELKRALDVRDRELGQAQVVRAIVHYAELEAIRDRLRRAQAEGTPVDDLPPGMTLAEALTKIEARIADEDRYVISMKDGYLVRNPAEMETAGDSSEAADARS